VVYSQNEKYDTIFIDFASVCKIGIKCRFFVRNSGVFDIAQVNFLKLLFYLTNREKSQNEKLLEFFSFSLFSPKMYFPLVFTVINSFALGVARFVRYAPVIG